MNPNQIHNSNPYLNGQRSNRAVPPENGYTPNTSYGNPAGNSSYGANPQATLHTSSAHTNDNWRYEDSRNSGDMNRFNARFADYSRHELKEGYYNLNGDLYYKGHKVQSGTHEVPVYETHQDTRTGKTVNTRKQKMPVWAVLVIIVLFILPCLLSALEEIAEIMQQL